jgi:AraC family transcriptional activator FtrA
MLKIMPKWNGPSNRRVAALLYDGLCSFEFGIVAEVFGLTRPELGVEWYSLTTCAEQPGPVRATGNVRMIAEEGLDGLAEAGTIVIPGWPTDGAPASPALKDAILSAHARGARLVTICSGVFLLASLRLLDGKRVTTHWRYAERLTELYPELQIEPDVLYIDEDRILTSAGSAAGIDLLLHIVRKDFGPEIANQVARRMVVPPHREGGQAQFVERPVPARPNGRLGPLLDTVRARPGEIWTIHRLAAEAAMSERTFIRRFKESVGSSPGEWLVAMRTDAARELLETGMQSLDEVAELAGFGSVATLRHHFRSRIGLTPASYRARFSHGAASPLAAGECFEAGRSGY